MKCEWVRSHLSLFLYGELSFEEEERLQQHLESCPDCTQALDRVGHLHAAADQLANTPTPELLAQCRSDLSSRLRSPEASSAGAKGLWNRLRMGFRGSSFGASLWQPAGALAMVALGFFAAQVFVAPTPESGPGTTEIAGATPVESRIRYITSEPSGGVRIVLEDTTQRILSGPLEDEEIRRLLLEATRDPHDPGLRAESVDILKRHPEPIEVRHALLAALRQDSNPGVRLEAIEALRPFSAEPEVRTTLAHVLFSDDNPGVRIQAVDMFVQGSHETEMAGVLQELLRTENDDYIRFRCETALREMNASLETF